MRQNEYYFKTTTVKEALFSDFEGEIKAWALGAVILLWFSLS
jgi:hypothetical protein